ncbi:hypothetical protein H2198_010945 [Neophaeococcomyces mojaviensis]|uniref:Uncharacterized protein n=1 Tax=Neophaeococcomyces mojaviensis TaxID=3383035 RepID=A0ACC2ZNR4_9EURO|nr:hypothetical protein H2198_010945 [Knufia sp. JES_112]
MSFHCYYKYSFSTAPEEHPGHGPCGQPGDSSNLQCCGIDDKCMSNGICTYSSSNPGGSGYYIGGCTDKTMQNPNCYTNCTSYENSDVVYDYTAGQWRCCGNDASGNRNCSLPQGTILTSGAKAPLELEYIATIVATGSSIPLATAVPILSSTSGSASGTGNGARTTVTVTATPGSSSSAGGLSPGASAGIAVAAVISVFLLAFGFCCIWRRRGHQYRRQHPSSPGDRTGEPVTPFPHYTPEQSGAVEGRRIELGNSSPGNTFPRRELP